MASVTSSAGFGQSGKMINEEGGKDMTNTPQDAELYNDIELLRIEQIEMKKNQIEENNNLRQVLESLKNEIDQQKKHKL